jgi:hypothetical protein
MPNERPLRLPEPAAPRETWSRPAAEVIPLDCEITAYAPAGDEPLL